MLLAWVSISNWFSDLIRSAFVSSNSFWRRRACASWSFILHLKVFSSNFICWIVSLERFALKSSDSSCCLAALRTSSSFSRSWTLRLASKQSRQASVVFWFWLWMTGNFDYEMLSVGDRLSKLVYWSTKLLLITLGASTVFLIAEGGSITFPLMVNWFSMLDTIGEVDLWYCYSSFEALFASPWLLLLLLLLFVLRWSYSRISEFLCNLS